VQVKGKYPQREDKRDAMFYGYAGPMTGLHPDMVLVIPYFTSDLSGALNFEGINSPGVQTTPIGSFYSGLGGPDFGIEFSPNALALCLNTLVVHCSNASRGGQGNPASQSGGLISSGPFTIMNSAPGFADALSFWYAAVSIPGSIELFSGLNGTGALLATRSLGLTAIVPGCGPAYAADYCPFQPFGVQFAGTAHSVEFDGGTFVAYDDVDLGSLDAGNATTTTTPEPGTAGLVATGLFAAAMFARRRQAGRTRRTPS
jgi:hypothetical protein